MRQSFACVCLTLLLAAPALGDILPTPDRGPQSGKAGGLSFSIQWVEPPRGSVSAPHVSRHAYQIVVLDGCEEARPNCELAHSRNLIGMEVRAIDGVMLRPEEGMVRQIIGAFEHKELGRRIRLEMFSRGSDNEPFEVAFARR